MALELHDALSEREDIDYKTRFLRASWKRIHRASALFLARTVPALRRMARRDEVDVVLFSSMVTASLVLLVGGAFRRHGVRAAAIVHGLDVTTPSRLYQWLVPRIFARLDLVMPVSAATGEACLERGLPPSRLRPVRNGVDVSRFQTPVHARGQRREALGRAWPELTPGTEVTVLASVGRQVRRKGFDWFIRCVLPDLPETVQYWLAGDGPEAESIRQAVSETGLGHRVRLLGRVSEDELEALYRGADLFVMPNVPVPGDMEGFGVVMLEAGMNGLPTVGARLEGIAEVIEDGANGYLIPSGDAEGFRSRVGGLVSDPTALEALSERAFRYTRETFSWEAVADEYVETMRERLGPSWPRDETY